MYAGRKYPCRIAIWLWLEDIASCAGQCCLAHRVRFSLSLALNHQEKTSLEQEAKAGLLVGGLRYQAFFTIFFM